MAHTSDPKAQPGNRLATETSPYLLQHAHNPVDWHAWGPDAFATASASGKPVLLSIGYSACHWCHVMAHESFEDPGTAAVMNELFVNIKVDREERPDVDRIYQLAHQLLTQRGGGWPLTMFLTHDDQRPFFGGTYFPPQPRHGMPDFRTVLRRVAQYYGERQHEVRAQSHALVEALATIDAPAAPLALPLNAAPLQLLRRQLEQRFDRQYGGFSGAPKFPHAGMIQRLLRHWQATAHDAAPDLQALFMATLTLKRMADGGFRDQLAGGFYRYSVDERWEIPHFEKMLYDNGALLSAYAEAASATGDPDFAHVAAHTADFLLREMRAPGGAFHSSWDADSEGHEGLFYLWTPAQIDAALQTGTEPGAQSARLFKARYGLDRPANFEGRWHLVATREISELADSGNFTPDPAMLETLLGAARSRLLEVRAMRIAPGRDDKIVTSWNALVIKGLADTARALGRDDLATVAADAVDWLWRHHWRDGRLCATSKDGDARLPGYLDDHALLLDAVLALLTVRFSTTLLQFATSLADALLQNFEDADHGGFYFTAHDQEQLIHRTRSFSDDATPSGNAIAVSALQKLGWLLGDTRYLDAAERGLRAAWPTLAQSPLAQVHMANALDDHLQQHVFVILRGEPAQIDLWRRELQRVWRPQTSVIAIATETRELPQSLAERKPQGFACAYLCRGSVCEAPCSNLADLIQALQRRP
ncbi:MAG: thioredoxin domain-containing protein [Steroidobacteraceae bacterium]